MAAAIPQVYPTQGPALHSGLALNINIANGLRNNNDGIVALAGGGASASTPRLVNGVNKVITVASANDSVMLPVSVPGAVVFVSNTGANSMQVFANTTSALASNVLDTINGTAGATGVAVANAKTAIFMCTAYGAWFGPVALA